MLNAPPHALWSRSFDTIQTPNQKLQKVSPQAQAHSLMAMALPLLQERPAPLSVPPAQTNLVPGKFV